MRRAMQLLEGLGPQESALPENEYNPYDHPYFGQVVLGLALKLAGYPHSLNPTVGEISSIQDLYLVPRLLMGILSVIDTILVYKISEKRYNRNVALIASVLFAVMPMTWLLRRILLDSILLPFLLSSILFAIYYNREMDRPDKKRPELVLALFSGVFLGLAIFTKIPAFTFIPLISYIAIAGSAAKTWRMKWKSLGILLIPMILIPAIWPLYAIKYGQFDEWLEGIDWQTSRSSRPLFDPSRSILEIDPVLVIIGILGGIYVTIRKDYLFVLWFSPYVLFLYFIGYSQYIPHSSAFSLVLHYSW